MGQVPLIEEALCAAATITPPPPAARLSVPAWAQPPAVQPPHQTHCAAASRAAAATKPMKTLFHLTLPLSPFRPHRLPLGTLCLTPTNSSRTTKINPPPGADADLPVDEVDAAGSTGDDVSTGTPQPQNLQFPLGFSRQPLRLHLQIFLKQHSPVQQRHAGPRRGGPWALVAL
jgi:hypothetical protein